MYLQVPKVAVKNLILTVVECGIMVFTESIVLFEFVVIQWHRYNTSHLIMNQSLTGLIYVCRIDEE